MAWALTTFTGQGGICNWETRERGRGERRRERRWLEHNRLLEKWHCNTNVTVKQENKTDQFLRINGTAQAVARHWHTNNKGRLLETIFCHNGMAVHICLCRLSKQHCSTIIQFVFSLILLVIASSARIYQYLQMLLWCLYCCLGETQENSMILHIQHHSVKYIIKGGIYSDFSTTAGWQEKERQPWRSFMSLSWFPALLVSSSSVV